MKRHRIWVALALAAAVSLGAGQTVYRAGNSYSDNPAAGAAVELKPNVIEVPAITPSPYASVLAVQPAPQVLVVPAAPRPPQELTININNPPPIPFTLQRSGGYYRNR